MAVGASAGLVWSLEMIADLHCCFDLVVMALHCSAEVLFSAFSCSLSSSWPCFVAAEVPDWQAETSILLNPSNSITTERSASTNKKQSEPSRKASPLEPESRQQKQQYSP